MAYDTLYRRVIAGQPEDVVLRVDALLGLEGAAEAYAESRYGAVTTSGFEVG